MTKGDQDEATFKVVLVGDAGTGKTSLVTRLTNQTFDPVSTDCNLINVNTHEFKMNNNETVMTNIWDLAGGQNYHSMTHLIFDDASAVMLVYDISNAATFKRIPAWLKLVRSTGDHKKIMLIGNKTDLDNPPPESTDMSTASTFPKMVPDWLKPPRGSKSKKTAQLAMSRAVSTEDAQSFAIKNGLLFMETSAFNGDHVVSAFQQMIISSDDTRQETPFHVVLIDRKSAANGEIQCVEKPMQGDLKFVALSYRWGELQEITVDTTLDYMATVKSFRLEDFYRLCRLMDYDPDLAQMDYVWVDAICVDQTNDERRKATIYHMSEIYEHANHILAVPDLHLQHLKNAFSNTYNIIDYYRDNRHYFYYFFHGSYERLYELDEIYLDDIGVPKHPDIRQWFTTKTDLFTRGLINYELHHKRYNPIDALEHLCEAIQAASRNLDYEVHYCNKTNCPLNYYSDDGKSKWQVQCCQKALEAFESRTESNRLEASRWVRMILDRSSKIRQVVTHLMDLMTDWSTRAWVISEISIARKKNNLKYWFLHATGGWPCDDLTEATLGFYKFDFDNPAVSFTEKPLGGTIYQRLSEPILLEFHNLMIKQLDEQTFFEKMLRSKASRHEDRFYAVLPNSPYKHILKSKHVVSNWDIQSLVSVKLKLYEWMTVKDKLRLFFLSVRYDSLTLHPTSPTFATPSIAWESGVEKYPPAGDCEYNLDKIDAIQLLLPADNDLAQYCLRIKPNEYYISQATTLQWEYIRGLPEYEAICERLQIKDRSSVRIACIPPFVIPGGTLDKEEVPKSIYLIGSGIENRWEIHKLRLDYQDWLKYRVYSTVDTSFRDLFDIF